MLLKILNLLQRFVRALGSIEWFSTQTPISIVPTYFCIKDVENAKYKEIWVDNKPIWSIVDTIIVLSSPTYLGKRGSDLIN
jgi:hypothetical protein